MASIPKKIGPLKTPYAIGLAVVVFVGVWYYLRHRSNTTTATSAGTNSTPQPADTSAYQQLPSQDSTGGGTAAGGPDLSGVLDSLASILGNAQLGSYTYTYAPYTSTTTDTSYSYDYGSGNIFGGGGGGNTGPAPAPAAPSQPSTSFGGGGAPPAPKSPAAGYALNTPSPLTTARQNVGRGAIL